ncbi:MAG TPA: hypothetical protein VHL80_16845 [Polyangia bacterium]|nr:hypothetical protein [Polyangia bacterium]
MTRKKSWAIGLLLGAACAAREPNVKPTDMSAAEHRAEAQRQDELAKADASHYRPGDSRVVALAPPGNAMSGIEFPVSVYNPTESYLRNADEHRAHAKEHERAAAALERFEAGECKAFPERTRAACPLLGPVTKIDDVERGVRVTFAPGTRVDAVAAHMRCHYAFARAHGFEARVSCPLYMPGIQIEQAGAAAVEIKLRNKEQIGELRARAREEAVFAKGATP